MRIKLPGLFFFCSPLLGILIGCNDPQKSTFVDVNGDKITFGEFYAQIQSKPTVRVKIQDQDAVLPVSNTLAFQALEDLINQRLLLQLAMDEKVLPTNKDIDKELQFKRKLNPRFIDNLTQRGYNIQQIRDLIKLDLSREKLLTKGVSVDIKEVNNFINKNPKQFIQPATADLYWIFVRKETDKKKVDDEILTGQAFSSVAIRLSQYPDTKRLQGRFPQRVVEALPPSIRNAVEKTNIGSETDWIKVQNGFAKFYVEQKTRSKPINMDETKKIALQRQMSIQRGQLANDLDKRLMDKFKSSAINVEFHPLQKPWKTYSDRLIEISRLDSNNSASNPSNTQKTNRTISPDLKSQEKEKTDKGAPPH